MRGLVRGGGGGCGGVSVRGPMVLVVMDPVDAVVLFVGALLRGGDYGVGFLMPGGREGGWWAFGRWMWCVGRLSLLKLKMKLILKEGEGGGRGSVGDLGGRRRRRVDVVGGHSSQTNGTAIKPARAGGMELEGVVNRVRFGGREEGGILR